MSVFLVFLTLPFIHTDYVDITKEGVYSGHSQRCKPGNCLQGQHRFKLFKLIIKIRLAAILSNVLINPLFVSGYETNRYMLLYEDKLYVGIDQRERELCCFIEGSKQAGRNLAFPRISYKII